SSALSTRWTSSSASKTRPAQGTDVSPGTNGLPEKARSWYWRTSSRMLARSQNVGAAMSQELLVPPDRRPQTVVEREQRPPAQQPPRLGRAQILMADLVTRLVTHLGPQRRAHQVRDAIHEIEDRDLNLVGKIERLAAQLGPCRQLLGQQQVGRGPVLDI